MLDWLVLKPEPSAYLTLTPGPAQTWQNFAFQIWYMLLLKYKDNDSFLVARNAKDHLYLASDPRIITDVADP